jgi:drug/metabolite transporter superfamily protein YnfA
MRYLKLGITLIMFFSAFHAIRGTYLFHTTTEYHTPMVAQTIGSLSLTAFAGLILLFTIWNYRAIIKETA